MNIKKFKVRSYPGERAIQVGMAAGAAVASASGSALVWYGTAGLVTKAGLALGLVAPPVGMFATIGAGGGILAAAAARHLLTKKEREEARRYFDD